MLYYLAIEFKDQLNILNIFTYHTVRAGGAALTAFVLSLVAGPFLIRRLKALKIGQIIKREHVEDLHALHHVKAGTPTMGGVIMILATVVALVFWGQWTNPLLVTAAIVLCLLGAVGFMDDFLSLRRKHNTGLTARVKFCCQLLVGFGLGIYLVAVPVTESRLSLVLEDIRDWTGFLQYLSGAEDHNGAGKIIREQLAPDVQQLVTYGVQTGTIDVGHRRLILDALNEVTAEVSLPHRFAFPIPENPNTPKLNTLLEKPESALGPRDKQFLNRYYLYYVVNDAFPDTIAPRIETVHTKLGVPGLKNIFIPLGIAYCLFVVLVLVASSNAVNLTDGLDGLAIGVSVVSLLAYTAIAYIVSRADWSEYLYLVYVPDASELTVFGAALLGAGLGFLWFNSHPAEVFMGDTGSLAMGGAIGTMALLTKQELLLVLVGGVFVMEAVSVILQVASFKLRGKRLFKMAPIHHHFELMGWSESKVVIRFWILALVFALMSLATLKLR